MKAQDLRIGNLVRDYTDNCIVHILAEDLTNTRNFEPIPLTKEWLLKMGFEEKSKGEFIVHLGLYKFTASSHEYGIDFFYGSTYKDYIKPRFVHSLQNLYHSLTGEELTIK